MEVVTQYFNIVLDFMRVGFNGINASTQGLLIALAAAIFMQNWKQLIGMALLAVVVTLAVEALVPVISDNQRFALPSLFEAEFLRVQASRFVGYMVVIAIFFIIKQALFRVVPQGGAAKAKGH